VGSIGKLLTSRPKLWQKKNRAPPENNLVYRDDVSEGQYELVLRNELRNIHAACRDLYSSQIHCCCWHASPYRFYPETEGTANRSSNPPNGGVVDGQITEARNWNFFLQAYTTLQGAAKSAYYYVIFDEIFRPTYGIQAATKPEHLTQCIW
jgi:eukaryotic translation initiation factor 2C